MFILTSLWEVAVCLVTFMDLVVQRGHTIENLLQVVLNLQNQRLHGLKMSFLPPMLYFDISEEVGFMAKSLFASRNF